MHTPRHKILQTDNLLGSIRELVFGLEDSLVSTLGVVVGIAAGVADTRVVILSGVVLVVVEAVSMSAGSFLSSKSHREMLLQAIDEERHEIETEPEREREELVAMYTKRGFSPEEVGVLVKRITANKELWLEEMVAKELRINAADLEVPKKSAVVMLLSYVAGGVIPIVPFVLLQIRVATFVSIGVTLVALFTIGFIKGRVLSNDGVKSGAEMVAVAGSAALIGYVIGKGAGLVFGIDVTG